MHYLYLLPIEKHSYKVILILVVDDRLLLKLILVEVDDI